jgi:ATP-binding cassette, subfamily C (CFTR/MRP), member 1
MVCIILNIRQLGYSALVGLGVLILGFPFQGILVAIIFKQRTKGVKITDQRVRLTNEVCSLLCLNVAMHSVRK